MINSTMINPSTLCLIKQFYYIELWVAYVSMDDCRPNDKHLTLQKRFIKMARFFYQEAKHLCRTACLKRAIASFRD